MRNQRHPNRHGVSLLELLIVLTIVAATALLVIPMIKSSVETPSGHELTAAEIATASTMVTIREAFVGERGVLENIGHEPEAIPQKISDLLEEKAPEHIVENQPELVEFDPDRRVGWHGPYISMPNGCDPFGRPTVVDAWGKEISVQVDFDQNGTIDPVESKYVRIVSAGPDGEIDTPADQTNMEPGGEDDSNKLTRDECNDDLVIFLRVPDTRQ